MSKPLRRPPKRVFRLPCILCGSKHRPSFGTSVQQKEVERVGWNDAVAGNLQGGYGSTKFDCVSVTVCICDSCLAQAVAEGRASVLSNPWATA